MGNESFANRPYRDAMRELIAKRWREVWEAMPRAIAGEDIEGVHDVRVASRRLRAAMDVSGEAFPERWFRDLHLIAKQITGALGDVRDRDVLIEEFMDERAHADPRMHPAIDRLIRRLEGERADARTQMEAYLQGLLERRIPQETVRRFGEDARPDWLKTRDARR